MKHAPTVALWLAACGLLTPAPRAQAQLHRLDPAAGEIDDAWGGAVARDGDWLAVGAPRDDVNGIADEGSVTLLEWQAGSWAAAQELSPPNAEAGVQFGHAVDLQGDLLVVGAPYDDVLTSADQGSVRVYRRAAGVWTQEDFLTASDGAAGHVFGWDVAVDGDRIAVGAPGASFTGALYVFRRVAGSWIEEAIVTPPNGSPLDSFGWALDLRGDRIVTTAPNYSFHVQQQGAAYSWLFNGASWALEQQFGPNWGTYSQQFGSAVSLGDEQVLIGARWEDNDATGDGGAYLFDRLLGIWTETAHLTLPGATHWASMGASVDLQGEVAVVGVPSAEHPVLGEPTGSVLVHRRTPGGWALTDTLHADDGDLFDRLGSAVTIEGSQLVAGANGTDLAGATYVFSLAQDAWTDLGEGLAGSRGVPDLLGTGSLAAGTPVSLSLSDARPDATVCTVVGPAYLGAAFKGGVFGPAVVGSVAICQPTGPFGRFDAHLAWPPGYPSGFAFFVQSWVVDPDAPLGFASTATLGGVTP